MIVITIMTFITMVNIATIIAVITNIDYSTCYYYSLPRRASPCGAACKQTYQVGLGFSFEWS